MNTITPIKTGSITKTKLLVAVLALVLSGGLAFAAVPRLRPSGERGLVCVDPDMSYNSPILFSYSFLVKSTTYTRARSTTIQALPDTCITSSSIITPVPASSYLAERFCDGIKIETMGIKCPSDLTCIDGACVVNNKPR